MDIIRIPMTKYLDSPLKITGILLTLTGVFLSLFTTQPSLTGGYSIATMGVIMLLTAWMITRSKMKHKDRSIFEIILVLVIILFSILMAMDYYGIIAINRYMSISGI
jgi:glucose dehydrogenase